MTTLTTQRSLDRRGLTITTAIVFDVVAELQTMGPGEVLALLTDAYEPVERDIAAWCAATGHHLLRTEVTDHGDRFFIEKRVGAAKTTSLAMVISSHRLEELLSPLGFALAAALEGIAVNLYFQGPAVRVLRRGYRPRLRGWGRPFSRFAAADMAKSGHVPAQEKLGQLRRLGAEIYVCGPSAQRFKVAPEDLIFDDLPMVEYLTFMSVMEGADIQLFV